MASEAITNTVPAPVLGIDLVSPIDQMDPNYCLDLTNVVAAGLKCFLRNGYITQAKLGSSINATVLLQGLNNADGSVFLTAQSGTNLYNGINGTLLGTGYSNTPFNGDTFNYRGFLANGVDPVQVIFGGAATASTFTGVTLSNLINVSSYNERIYFIEKNTLNVWFGPTRAISGALTQETFQYAMKDGGYLVLCGSWTNNTADTSRDLFYAMSSEGEILFYQGQDPTDTTTPWRKVARYKIGRPLGYRANVRVGNDTWLLTDQGIVSIADLFSSDPSQAYKGTGFKINPYIVQQAALYPFSYQWSGTFWSLGRRVYITVPTSGSTSKTCVYHMDGGWTKYSINSDAAAMTMAVAGKQLYYGSNDGYTYMGETGQADGVNPVSFAGNLAFNFFGNRGSWKHFLDIRPLIKTKRSVNLSLGIDTNFQQGSNLSTISSNPGIYTPWGSPWGSPWSSGTEYIYERHNFPGQGHSGSVKFAGSIKNAPFELNGFEVGLVNGSRV